MAQKTYGRFPVPVAPVLDFAWLKQWWPEVERRKPHVGEPKVKRKYRMDNGMSTMAATKSEARALLKDHMGLDRLPPHTVIV